jgi:hypothetical protein
VVSNAVTEVKHVRRRRVPVLKAGDFYLAVHRHENAVYYKRLEREEYFLLTRLGQGSTLGEALEEAFASSRVPEGERAPKVQAWFANWAELGWFCRHRSAAARRAARKRVN